MLKFDRLDALCMCAMAPPEHRVRRLGIVADHPAAANAFHPQNYVGAA
jgi:hypothetical protein